ncbi:MAG: hypothetical protein ACLSUW_00710 [Akkermansia sp.]
MDKLQVAGRPVLLGLSASACWAPSWGCGAGTRAAEHRRDDGVGALHGAQIHVSMTWRNAPAPSG